MNSCKGLFFVFAVTVGLYSIPALGSTAVAIKGNSIHGIGDGSGSWNVTASFLGVSTTTLAYNTLFTGSQQEAPVYALANSVYEQLGCTSNASCNVGDGTPVDFMFQIPVSQIQGGLVTFTNFTGTLPTLEIESCDGPSTLSEGPGFLCTTYPSGTGNLSVGACLSGTTLTFMLSGSLTSLGSVTFLLQYPNTAATLSAPTMAATPKACAAPAILADFVAADSPLANTPCFNCVNGSTSGTFGLTEPLVYISGTSTIQLVLYYEDSSYKGTCELTFTIKQGSTVLSTVSTNITGFTAKTVGYVYQQITPPTAIGATTLTGSLKCGSNPTTSASGPLYFQ
jgi:hypothetical protein